MTEPRRGIALGAFVALSLVAYARILNGWFLSDDDMIAIVAPDGKHVAWDHVLRVFYMDWGERGDWAPLRYYRPLVVLSQAFDAALWGVKPFGFHLTNAVLHGINGYLLYRIARALDASAGVAICAGAAFVLFPWNPESVAWISGRTDVLSAIGTLGSLALYLEARGTSGSHRARLLAGSFALFVFGFMSKEPAIALPLMVVGVDLCSGIDARAPWRSLRRVLPSWAAFGALALAYLGLRIAALGNVWGGDAVDFYGPRRRSFEHLRDDWSQNLLLLVSPYNREAVGDSAHGYAMACVAGGLALVAALCLSVRGRRLPKRLLLTSLALFVGSVAPFAVAIGVSTNLENSRFLYLPTAFFCLFLGALAAPVAAERLSLVFSGAFLALLAALLTSNLTPWVEASDTMRRVTHTYAAAFGSGSGEPIEKLPTKHHGAYMALFNSDAMVRAYLPDAPPRPEMVAAMRAVFVGSRRDLKVLPDPVAGASERLSQDRRRAEWLFPPDGSALNDAVLEGIDLLEVRNSVYSFRVKSRASWLLLPGNANPELPRLPGADEYAYLLVRPAPPTAPNLFWVSRETDEFEAPRFVVMAPELVARDGRVEQRRVDGFSVYAYPLHESPHWHGMERIRSLRLDPHFEEGTFEIRFFGISRHLPPEAAAVSEPPPGD